jgi:hypothetical protein
VAPDLVVAFDDVLDESPLRGMYEYWRSKRGVVGAIADGLAWQWSLWINLPIGVTVVPLVLVGAITALALPGRYEMAIAQAKA